MAAALPDIPSVDMQLRQFEANEDKTVWKAGDYVFLVYWNWHNSYKQYLESGGAVVMSNRKVATSAVLIAYSRFDMSASRGFTDPRHFGLSRPIGSSFKLDSTIFAYSEPTWNNVSKWFGADGPVVRRYIRVGDSMMVDVDIRAVTVVCAEKPTVKKTFAFSRYYPYLRFGQFVRQEFGFGSDEVISLTIMSKQSFVPPSPSKALGNPLVVPAGEMDSAGDGLGMDTGPLTTGIPCTVLTVGIAAPVSERIETFFPEFYMDSFYEPFIMHLVRGSADSSGPSTS